MLEAVLCVALICVFACRAFECPRLLTGRRHRQRLLTRPLIRLKISLTRPLIRLKILLRTSLLVKGESYSPTIGPSARLRLETTMLDAISVSPMVDPSLSLLMPSLRTHSPPTRALSMGTSRRSRSTTFHHAHFNQVTVDRLWRELDTHYLHIDIHSPTMSLLFMCSCSHKECTVTIRHKKCDTCKHSMAPGVLVEHLMEKAVENHPHCCIWKQPPNL